MELLNLSGAIDGGEAPQSTKMGIIKRRLIIRVGRENK
jgi:hypothetical protein